MRETVWHHLTAEPSSSEGSAQATLGRLVVVERRKPESRPKPKAQAAAPAQGVPAQVSLAAFQEDLCFAYIFSNFVWRGYGGAWLHQSAQGLQGQLAFDSVRSLAEISFGTAQKSQETEIQGRVKYGKVLRLMVERLGDGQKNKLWELVIPILLLLMHNVSEFHLLGDLMGRLIEAWQTTLTNQPATLFHLKAMSRILAACGPQMFLHQPLRDAFEAARATLVRGLFLLCLV